MPDLKITALVENTSGAFDYLGEWGLSLWIECGGHFLLYDTGQGRSLRPNATRARIDLSRAQALVVSHGHSDHTGGIAELVAAGFRGRVYAHPGALAKKYHREDGVARQKGIPETCEQALRRLEVVASSQPTEIAPGIVASGTIPRRTAFEDIGDAFFVDEQCTRPDTIADDQALLIDTPGGWVVITGCGHAGVVNTLLHARELAGSRPIRALIGGMHLLKASPERIQATAEHLKSFNLEIIAPCHCTGFAATAYFQNQFGPAAKELRAGLKCEFA